MPQRCAGNVGGVDGSKPIIMSARLSRRIVTLMGVFRCTQMPGQTAWKAASFDARKTRPGLP